MEESQEGRNPIAVGVIGLVLLLALCGIIIAWMGVHASGERASSQNTSAQ